MPQFQLNCTLSDFFLVGQLPHLPNYSYDTGGPIIINRNQFDGQCL